MEPEFSIDDGFDKLYFALGVQTEEEKEYVENRFDEFYKEHVGYDIIDCVDESFFGEDSSKEIFLENLAEPMAGIFAESLGKCLKIEENALDGFYDKEIEERFDYLVSASKNYSAENDPELSLENRIEKFDTAQ